MARTQHDLTWLDLNQTEAAPSVSSDTSQPGTFPNVQHMPDGGVLLHTGPNNYIRLSPNRVVKCVETTVF